VSPRLSEVAEAISADYVEGAGFVKLIRQEGEIDFLASPNLTATPFETWSLERRSVRVETAAEIVAKKLWHRGDQVSARDLFDLSLDHRKNRALFFGESSERWVGGWTPQRAG
jgi:hypothetical protein